MFDTIFTPNGSNHSNHAPPRHGCHPTHEGSNSLEERGGRDLSFVPTTPRPASRSMDATCNPPGPAPTTQYSTWPGAGSDAPPAAAAAAA
jgi:hypothetical protein